MSPSSSPATTLSPSSSAAPTPLPPPECSNGDQASYRGSIASTISGKSCQKWTDQDPHSHSRTPENYPDFGLG
eukprot:CAMPEP_0198149246 /NCGR_PEP_ID=MMETSP1443-20131203/45604_1 /TAXON_ID=186043 /ORGANISM="Entomoneis sp., Strain CCMP2396" /LENGTH=72 /DNA_ID=CAMNT_0043814213 /DNA_START=8 /DNA_END=223 /DNA_ORIENTATION=-